MRSILFTILTFLLLSNASADTEPNNTWQTATALPQDSSVAGIQSDDDWYVINITSNPVQRLLIDLTFTHADGNIDIAVYGDDFVISNPAGIIPGLFRDISAGSTSDHEFTDHDISASGPGAYYVKVSGAISGGNQGNSYTLTWTELTSADDGFEENDTSASVSAITEDVVSFGSQSDDDWYSINVTSGHRRVLASLRFYNTELATSIDMNMELLDSNGISIASSTNASGINESINAVVPTANTYHVRITGDNNADGYALDWAGVNEVPQAIANTVSTTENIPYSFMASDLTFSDSEGDSLVSATLNNLALGGGTLTHSSGTPVSDLDTLTAAELDTLVYTPSADTTGSPLATFTFTVNDAEPGTISAQLGINVTADVTAPVITVTTGMDMVEQGGIWIDAGATTTDNVDADGVATTTDTVDTSVVGDTIITYTATDAAGNAATPVTRTVMVTLDATAPVITLTGSQTVSIELSTAYVDAGATAQDNIDGPLAVTTTNPVNIDVEGSYIVIYNAADAAGNAAIPITRTVNVTAVTTTPAEGGSSSGALAPASLLVLLLIGLLRRKCCRA